ncbi:hypothetical protein SELMODRAFT_404873 [Selaginella moellendorffii]|uniref:Uncharacterized protein n=1 Tax=Selaginella moellendorffii TaxID=88036 RepID=D8QXM4_SELML|nr:hypothetical protein SELMODRAFT_404873 [Selaginella moellendorffii]
MTENTRRGWSYREWVHFPILPASRYAASSPGMKLSLKSSTRHVHNDCNMSKMEKDKHAVVTAEGPTTSDAQNEHAYEGNSSAASASDTTVLRCISSGGVVNCSPVEALCSGRPIALQSERKSGIEAPGCPTTNKQQFAQLMLDNMFCKLIPFPHSSAIDSLENNICAQPVHGCILYFVGHCYKLRSRDVLEGL